MSERFDPAKDTVNRERHGLPLVFGDRIFLDPDHLVLSTFRPEDGERRFKAIGRVGDKIYTAVFTWRSELPRFISVRRSNLGEERAYHSPP